jgi:hypothetical protein
VDLTKEERERVLAAVRNETFKLFLRFLEQTGARPYSEAAPITAEMIDWDGECIPLKKHKNARKGKKRVIYLTDEAQAILRELVEMRPTGPLFRTRYDHAYNRSNIIKAFRRLEETLGIERFNPYSYRHTFITDALERGLSGSGEARPASSSRTTVAPDPSLTAAYLTVGRSPRLAPSPFGCPSGVPLTCIKRRGFYPSCGRGARLPRSGARARWIKPVERSRVTGLWALNRAG